MITVTLSGEGIQNIRNAMREFLGDDPMKATGKSVQEIEKAFEQTKPASVGKDKSQEAVTQPAQAAQTSSPATVSYKDIADYIPKAVAKYGRGKIVTLLEKFGAKNGKELKTEQYAEVMAKLKAEYPL